MKVSELIAKLQELPPDLNVMTRGSYERHIGYELNTAWVPEIIEAHGGYETYEVDDMHPVITRPFQVVRV